MRKAQIGQPPRNPNFENPLTRWLTSALHELARASHEHVTGEVADAYTLENVTETRTLDPTTATAEDVANVLATLLLDLQNRGVKRG